MSYEQANRDRYYNQPRYGTLDRDEYEVYEGEDHKEGARGSKRYHDEIYSKRVPAGKRTYFFDVKTTRSGDDFFVTITESKRVDEGHYEKHKIFLYKEDFGKFISAMHEVVQHIKDKCLPGYDFHDLPDLPVIPTEEDEGAAYSETSRDY